MDYFGQRALSAPTVFNWFSPTYTISGEFAGNGLVAPEFEIATSNRDIKQFNFFNQLLYTNNGIRINDTRSDTYYAGRQENLIAENLDYLAASYIEGIDTNNNGLIDANEIADLDLADRDRAVELLLRKADLLHCGGSLVANRTGDSKTDPFQIMYEGLIDAFDHWDKREDKIINVINGRTEMVIYLVGTAPQCSVQK